MISIFSKNPQKRYKIGGDCSFVFKTELNKEGEPCDLGYYL